VVLRIVESPASDEVTLAEAAELLGVHPNTIRNRIRSGVYSPRKVPSAAGPDIYLIKRAELAIPAPPPSPSWRAEMKEALWSDDPRRRRIQAIVWIVGGVANLCAWSFGFGRGWESMLHEQREATPRT
jgi:hypothetical protein